MYKCEVDDLVYTDILTHPHTTSAKTGKDTAYDTKPSGLTRYNSVCADCPIGTRCWSPPIRAVMVEEHPDLLEDRRRAGAARWDEIWDGVIHMPPMPHHHIRMLKVLCYLDSEHIGQAARQPDRTGWTPDCGR